jgi:hypothetical protein
VRAGTLRALDPGVKNETKRVVVWIDHAAASVVRVASRGAGTAKAPPDQAGRLSATPPSIEVANRHVDRDPKGFFRKVRRKLKGATRILIVGPSSAKLDFLRFIGKRSHAMESRVVGIETFDDRSDERLVAYAKRYFDPTKAA